MQSPLQADKHTPLKACQTVTGLLAPRMLFYAYQHKSMDHTQSSMSHAGGQKYWVEEKMKTLETSDHITGIGTRLMPFQGNGVRGFTMAEHICDTNQSHRLLHQVPLWPIIGRGDRPCGDHCSKFEKNALWHAGIIGVDFSFCTWSTNVTNYKESWWMITAPNWYNWGWSFNQNWILGGKINSD